jgi:hypothetical protein
VVALLLERGANTPRNTWRVAQRGRACAFSLLAWLDPPPLLLRPHLT